MNVRADEHAEGQGWAMMETGLRRQVLRLTLAAAVTLTVLLCIPVPYVIHEPGAVIPVDGRVFVGGSGRAGTDGADSERHDAAPVSGNAVRRGEHEENGEWLLTTVYMRTRANLWSVLETAWRTDREAHPKRAVFQGGDARSFAARMNILMMKSQRDAAEAAYRAAGAAYEAVPDGLYVMRDAGEMKAGDRITAAGGRQVDGEASLRAAMQAAGGGPIELTVQREGSEIVVRLESEPGAGGTSAMPAALAAAELTETRRIRPADAAHEVRFNAGNIAGPSAGLPLALYIHERLTGEKLAGGLRIAATGTIDPAGTVGAVGGAALKAAAAARAGADLFLVPRANEAEAAAAADKTGGGMIVAGVESLEEALRLLRTGEAALRKAAR